MNYASYLTFIFSGHRCETRISESEIKTRLKGVVMRTINIVDLFPFFKGFYSMRKVFGSADIIYTNSEIPHVIFIKYFLYPSLIDLANRLIS